MLTVQDLLDSKKNYLLTIRPDQTVQEALEIMAANRISSLPVTEHDRLVGIVSDRDYVRKVAPKRIVPWNVKVMEIMTQQVVSVTRFDSIRECMRLMSARGFRHLPVLADRKLVGIVSITDVVRALSRSPARPTPPIETAATASTALDGPPQPPSH